jgi:hypothetical protein
VAGLKAVYQWVMRTMMKSKGETGIVQTMPKKDLVELNTQITAQRLMQNGIDPTQLKNADQVENAIIAIESKPKTRGVTSTKSAKVFDMEGREIDPKKGIMGGRQIDDLPPGDDDLPPPGSRGGPDDIAAPIQSADESLRDMMEAEIKKTLETGNKKGIARIRARQKMLNDAIDDASPGFSGDRKVDAELVAENLAERMGKVYDDLPTKERLKLYDEAFQGLTKKKFDPEDMAQGGRAGFKMGRRAFLKLMGGVGAGIGALKAGLLNLGKEAAPMVEAAKETVTKAPDYFFALVDKIKRFGNSVDDAVADPRMERTYRYKNYELRENAFGEPGETIVTKTDDMGEFGYKEESMRFKQGGQTEDGFVPDEYEEITIRPDAEGKLKDVEDGIEDVSEIIEEATKSAPPIKKAGGGIAGMLGE